MAVNDILMGASGVSSSSGPLYVEDVFSTYLYTGNGTSQTITNGIDLATNGGLVWTKSRSIGTRAHELYDSARGVGATAYFLNTNNANAQNTASSSTGITAFNSNGYSIGSRLGLNNSAETYVSWTFRKAPKFFDVVTYTGNGASNRAIPHSLGVAPAVILVKSTSTADNWYLRSPSFDSSTYRILNTASTNNVTTNIWGTSTNTSTNFYVGNSGALNTNGTTYVAYLFASQAGGFGASGTDSIIDCNVYSGSGVVNTISLGWEPQWLFILPLDIVAEHGSIFDVMNGIPIAGTTYYLQPSTTSSVSSDANPGAIQPFATGFRVNSSSSYLNYYDAGTGDSATYLYIAIRRGLMKTPTSGTSVFKVSSATTPAPRWKTSSPEFPVDMAFFNDLSGTSGSTRDFHWADRLRGPPVLKSTVANGESTNTSFTAVAWDYSNGFYSSATNGTDQYAWMFRRAVGFFDTVLYTGNSSNRTIPHNLGVAPEMMIVKRRNSAQNWTVYHTATGNTKFLPLNQTTAPSTNSTVWNNTTPTSTVFTLGNNALVNSNGDSYVAYLFASCPGVSKLGTYTGNGSSQTINCGFTNGARFVLIKRYDVSDWWVIFDSVRGIVAASDPYAQLQSTGAQTTNEDVLDPDSSGFIVNAGTTAGLNVNNGTYLYLAIA